MFLTSNSSLNDYLRKAGLLEEEIIFNSFSNIDRKDFVKEELRESAYHDTALSIGCNQTISQPRVVAFMISLLNPKKGDKVLDIGFGSGWTTSLLAEIVGESGKVYGIEIVPEIYDFGRSNIEKYSFFEKNRVEVFLGNGRESRKETAPYDCILVSASDKDPQLALKLREDLKIGGRVVIPIKNSIFLFTNRENDFEMEEYDGFTFVPLI